MQIQDTEIKAKFEEALVENFDRLFGSCIVFAVIQLFYAVESCIAHKNASLNDLVRWGM
jgi:hypothetical protein